MADLKAIVGLLEKAEQKTIVGKRCFLLTWEAYQRVIDFLEDAPLEPDIQILSRGYNNFALSLTVNDKSVYYCCSESGPILDKLWKEKE